MSTQLFISAPQNYLSRNFYNLRFLALFLAFALNFILLFYKVRNKDKESLSFCFLSAVGARVTGSSLLSGSSRSLRLRPTETTLRGLDCRRAAGSLRARDCLKVQEMMLRDRGWREETTTMTKTSQSFTTWRRARATCSPRWPSWPCCTRSSPSSASSATTASR